MDSKFKELYENASSDMEIMALAYYMINSDPERHYTDEDVDILIDAFGAAIEGFLEVDIREFLKERGLMTEDGEIIEE